MKLSKSNKFTTRTWVIMAILFSLIGLLAYLWFGTSYFDVIK